MAELLSICIPTYCRAVYLRELLESLANEFRVSPELTQDIAIYISDNASPDETPRVAEEFRGTLPLCYKRNPLNVGPPENFLLLVRRAPGRYVWLLGDDEILLPGCLPRILQELRAQEPGLLVLSTQDPYSVTDPMFDEFRGRQFKNFMEFVKFCSRNEPRMLIAHSLISANIFLRTAHDDETAEIALLERNSKAYSFMYALAAGLHHTPRPVVFSAFVSLLVRIHGRHETNGVKPRAVDLGIHYWLMLSWRGYYGYLAALYGHPELLEWVKKNLPNPSAFRLWYPVRKTVNGYCWLYFGIRRRLRDLFLRTSST